MSKERIEQIDAETARLRSVVRLDLQVYVAPACSALEERIGDDVMQEILENGIEIGLHDGGERYYPSMDKELVIRQRHRFIEVIRAALNKEVK